MPDVEQLLSVWKKSGLGLGEIVRAGLSAGPFTGAAASIWSDVISFQRQKRVDEAIADLCGRLDALGSRFNANRIGEPEFELLADAINRASREHRDAKRQRFVRLIESSWTKTEVPFEQRALFNRAVDQFEDAHVRILKVLRTGYTNSDHALPFPALSERLFGEISGEQRSTILLPALTLLSPSGFGFVSRKGLTGEGKMLRGPFSPDWPAMSAGYWINPTGSRFLEFIQEPSD